MVVQHESVDTQHQQQRASTSEPSIQDETKAERRGRPCHICLASRPPHLYCVYHRLVAALCEPCTLQMSRFIIPHGRVHAFFRISSRAVHRRVPHDRFPHEGAWAPCGIENRVSIRAFFQEEMRKQIRRCSRQCTPDGGAAGEMRRDG